MPNWKKHEQYQNDVHQSCLNCPPVRNIAPMDTLIAVGFGTAQVRRGRKVIFDEQQDSENFHFLSEFEEMAKLDPNHSWTVELDAPLRSRTYQRHDEGKWVLIASGEGFA